MIFGRLPAPFGSFGGRNLSARQIHPAEDTAKHEYPCQDGTQRRDSISSPPDTPESVPAPEVAV